MYSEKLKTLALILDGKGIKVDYGDTIIFPVEEFIS